MLKLSLCPKEVGNDAHGKLPYSCCRLFCGCYQFSVLCRRFFHRILRPAGVNFRRYGQEGEDTTRNAGSCKTCSNRSAAENVSELAIVGIECGRHGFVGLSLLDSSWWRACQRMWSGQWLRY